jgi:hypothetical protein
MPDRRIDQPVLLAPAGHPAVQLVHQVRLKLQDAGAQQVGEQVVQAPPAALLVHGDEEQVGALLLLQHALAIGPAGDGIAERAAQSLQDRGL